MWILPKYEFGRKQNQWKLFIWWRQKAIDKFVISERIIYKATRLCKSHCNRSIQSWASWYVVKTSVFFVIKTVERLPFLRRFWLYSFIISKLLYHTFQYFLERNLNHWWLIQNSSYNCVSLTNTWHATPPALETLGKYLLGVGVLFWWDVVLLGGGGNFVEMCYEIWEWKFKIT